jgi:hypothetical protein
MTQKQIWDLLDIGGAFRERHRETIEKRLLSAGKSMLRSRDRTRPEDGGAKLFLHPIDMSAINQCIHLASTVLLLGTDSDRLKHVVNQIRNERSFDGIDPTTIVTVVVLFNLIKEALANVELRIAKIKKETDQLSDDPEKTIALEKERVRAGRETDRLKQILSRFADLNWMVNSKAASVLGLAS